MGRSTLMLVVGIFSLRLVATGGYSSFVQLRMRTPLLAAAALLIAFGVVEAIGSLRQSRNDPGTNTRSISPAVGWLLAAPLIVLTAVAPTALGAAAAQRAEPISPTLLESADEVLDDVDADDGPVQLPVYEFVRRALRPGTGSIEGVEVILTGLVVNDDVVADGFLLTRFIVSCCAADALPVQIALRSVDQPYQNDTWVEATVLLRPSGGVELDSGISVVEADVVDLIVLDGAPGDPYESPF